ncbi:MAG: flagellar hook capping FlgD N-terminal domain-containing protein [Solirubrobacteraceae bacterium]
MSTTAPVSTDTNGNTITGTSGTQISNPSATSLSSTEFLDLMMDELENQNPLDPSSSDPSQYLSELAQMTSVEQETDTAQSTAESATEQAVSQAVGLIGDTVTYVDQTTGAPVTGTVSSVQITSSGPTLTVAGVTGVDPSTITNVTAAAAAAGSNNSASSSGTSTSTTSNGSEA